MTDSARTKEAREWMIARGLNIELDRTGGEVISLLADYSRSERVAGMEEAAKLADELAAEHAEGLTVHRRLMCEKLEALAAAIRAKASEEEVQDGR